MGKRLTSHRALGESSQPVLPFGCRHLRSLPVNMSRVIAVVVLGMGIGAGVSVQAQEGPPPATRPARGPRGGGGGGAPANLGGAMRDMGQNYKMLKANAADPAKMEESDSRRRNDGSCDAAVAKLSNLPPMVQHLTGDEKAAKTADFRADITELQKALLSLEDAIAAKNTDDIKKGLDSLEAIMNKGHNEFIPKP